MLTEINAYTDVHSRGCVASSLASTVAAAGDQQHGTTRFNSSGAALVKKISSNFFDDLVSNINRKKSDVYSEVEYGAPISYLRVTIGGISGSKQFIFTKDDHSRPVNVICCPLLIYSTQSQTVFYPNQLINRTYVNL